MLKHLELSTEDSCLNKAGDNEPVFVLRAKDPLASHVVAYWASMARPLHGDAKTDEAFICAKQMADWLEDYVDAHWNPLQPLVDAGIVQQMTLEGLPDGVQAFGFTPTTHRGAK